MKHILLVFLLVLGITTSKSQNYDYGKVSKAELEEQYHPSDSSLSAAVLYKKEYIHFKFLQSEGFVQEREVHERIKIYNKEGLDRATKKIYLYYATAGRKESVSGLKAQTYNLVDGKIVKDKLTKDGKFKEDLSDYTKVSSFTMPNVKEGSVIEYKYRVSSPFSTIDDVIFQYNIPINKLDVKIITPEYYVYKQQFNLKADFLPKTEKSSRNIQVPFEYREDIISASETNIPALKEEAYAGNINNYRSKLGFELTATLNRYKVIERSFSNSWEDVTRTIYKNGSFGEQITKSNFFKDDVAAILEGQTDAFAKAFIIQEFVKSKVKWNGRYGVYAQKGIRNAYKENEGNVADINLLIVAMLRSQGVDANPVLVSTRDNGIPLFPTRQGFNYVICSVQNNGKYLLIDGTEKYSANNILPYRILNWQGRLIESNEASNWINLSPSQKSTETTMVNVAVEDDFTLSGKVRKSYDAYLAMSYREKHNDLSMEAKIKSHEDDKDGIEISNYNYENKDDIAKPVKITYDFELEDGIDEVGDKLYLNPLLFFAEDENPFKLEERQYPIDFVIPMQDKYMVNIKIPDGYKVEALPKNEAFTFNDGQVTFKYIVNSNGNFLRLNFNFDITMPFINASDYKIFKEFFDKYIEKQAEQVVLTKA